MDHQHLRETLEKLHSELESTPSVDDESRELLRGLMKDVQELLARSGEGPHPRDQSIGERLRHGIQYFEVTHPRLAAMMEQVINTLSGAGI